MAACADGLGGDTSSQASNGLDMSKWCDSCQSKVGGTPSNCPACGRSLANAPELGPRTPASSMRSHPKRLGVTEADRKALAARKAQQEHEWQRKLRDERKSQERAFQKRLREIKENAQWGSLRPRKQRSTLGHTAETQSEPAVRNRDERAGARREQDGFDKYVRFWMLALMALAFLAFILA